MDHDSIDNDAFDLMQDLERQTPQEFRRKRQSHRIAVKARVLVQSGNSSELAAFKIEGMLGDISANGFRVITSLPMGVGDVYRVSFRDALAELPLTFVRCIRCQMVREGAYESGFQSFQPMALPDVGGLADEADLLARGSQERS